MSLLVGLRGTHNLYLLALPSTSGIQWRQVWKIGFCIFMCGFVRTRVSYLLALPFTCGWLSENHIFLWQVWKVKISSLCVVLGRTHVLYLLALTTDMWNSSDNQSSPWQVWKMRFFIFTFGFKKNPYFLFACSAVYMHKLDWESHFSMASLRFYVEFSDIAFYWEIKMKVIVGYPLVHIWFWNNKHFTFAHNFWRPKPSLVFSPSRILYSW